MISAMHLSYLTVSEIDIHRNIYYSASLQYLSKTLRLYRPLLSRDITLANADPIIAVSILLYHYAWASVDDSLRLTVLFGHSLTPSDCSPGSFIVTSPLISNDRDSCSIDLSGDPLLRLSAGLRNVFLTCGAVDSNSESVFLSHALYRPRIPILRAAQQVAVMPLREVESCLLDHFYPQHWPDSMPLSPFQIDEQEPFPADYSENENEYKCLTAYAEAAGRLAPILTLLQLTEAPSSPEISASDSCADEPPTQPNSPHPHFRQAAPTADDTGSSGGLLLTEEMNFHYFKSLIAEILPDISRYLFTFPLHFCSTLKSLAIGSDPRAFFILLYFYHAVRCLLPEDLCWWSRRRAITFEKRLGRALEMPTSASVLFQRWRTQIPKTNLASSHLLRSSLNGQCTHDDGIDEYRRFARATTGVGYVYRSSQTTGDAIL